MSAQLLAFLSAAKTKLSALANFALSSPKLALAAGIAAGYLGSPVIKLAIDTAKLALSLVKHL